MHGDKLFPTQLLSVCLPYYADYFDVSLDYIFGRCDEPQGKLYNYQPKIFENDERMQDFIEMCFDPSSAANAKLKEAVLKLLKEQENSIEMLINEKILKKDDLGFLSLYDLLEATILFDLYKNGFASNKFLIEHTLGKALETLKTKDWIHAQSSLLAKPECDYFDFYLNKSQFVNGQDLRNTYLHGTQRKRGTDDDLHRVNYYRLLMFVVMIVIKINDELCYKDEHLEKDKQ